MLRKIRKMLKQQEGFTLVELMIVVVILGILAGVGIQQYGNVQQRAREAADEANRKVLTSATNMYLMMSNHTLTGETNPITVNELVPDYLDAWPENPNGQPYTVNVAVRTESEVPFYSVTVGPKITPDS